MINMKKVLILVFVMLLVSGCGNKEENKVENNKENENIKGISGPTYRTEV